MKKIEYWYGTRNDRVYGDMEVSDDTTNAQINSMISDMLYDYVGYGFEEVKSDENY